MNPPLLLPLILLGASLALARQADGPMPAGASLPTDASPLTNAAPLAQQVESGGELEGVDGIAGTNEVDEPLEPGQTAAPTQAGEEPRSRGARGAYRRPDGRQSKQNRLARERQRARPSPGNPRAGTDSGTNGPGSLDYAAFRVIVELNIFDPNRVPSGPRPVQAPRAEYFGLVGTMRYNKGTFAFFSGSGSRYEKALKVSDSIAGYKLTNIAADSVKLVYATTNVAADPVNAGAPWPSPHATNEFEMRMGQQMRREESGPWQLAAAPSRYAGGSSFSPVLGSESSGTNSAAAAGGAENETLKRMMQRRAQE